MGRGRATAIIASGLALCAWCGWASGFRRSTAPAVATWAVSFLAVVVVDLLLWQGGHGRGPTLVLQRGGDPWPRRDRAPARRARTGTAPWLGLVLVVLVWEILGIDTGTREPHLTISALAQAFRALDAAMLLLWILAGLGYGAVRARAPGRRAPARTDDGSGTRSPLAALFVLLPRDVPSPHRVPALLLPPDRPAGVAFWLGVLVAACGIDLAARRTRGRMATAEELLRWTTASRLGNVAAVSAWTYAGFHLFAR